MMRHGGSAFLAAAWMILLCGCERQPPAPAPPAGQTAPAETGPAPDDALGAGAPPVSHHPYDGPETSVTILSPTSARVEVLAPTGGHELRLNAVEVIDGEARLFFMLEQPGPDEIVSQAQETLTHVHEGEREFDGAKAYIHIITRGRRLLMPDFRLAAASE